MGTVLVEAFAILCSLAILLSAPAIVHVFSSDAELVRLASTFLRIAVGGYVVTGFVGVLQQSISGAGDTLMPMVVSLLAMWLVLLPLAFFLSRNTSLGVYGIRWAIVASSAANAIAYTTYFRLGKWKQKRV